MEMKIRTSGHGVSLSVKRKDNSEALIFGQQLIDEAEKRNRMFLTRKIDG